MGSAKHLRIFNEKLEQGVVAWNNWRDEHPFIEPQLYRCQCRGEDLSGINLKRAYLYDADFSDANLTRANLDGAHLRRANLQGTNLQDAWMLGAVMIETKLQGAQLDGARVHGISVWRIETDENTKQRGLIITQGKEATVTVDDLAVAQFVYLLLHNPNIRKVISTIGKKGVLILGRFSDERKPVLDSLRRELRKRGYVPIVFDFEKADERDLTETVLTLAGMSKFVIADISKPHSVPHELAVVAPNYMIPFKPILQKGEKPYAMFSDYRKRFDKWVLPRLEYRDEIQLTAVLEDAIIRQAEEKHQQLLDDKAREDVAEDADDYE